MIVKMIQDLGKRMEAKIEKLEVFNRVRKYKEPKRDEEYNNCNEKIH